MIFTTVTLALALTAGAGTLNVDVRNVDTFEKDFNAAKGSPRIVTILSPT